MPESAGSYMRNARKEDGGLQPLDRVRSHLAVLWICGFSLVFLLVAVQSLNGRYGGHEQEAWAWLLPNITPTMGTILAGLGYTALDPYRSHATVRTGFYLAAYWLSVFYLVLILLTILIAPTRPEGVTGKGAVELMHTANLWLGPTQGFVATALGVLFASKEKRQPAAAEEAAGSGD